MFIVFEGPEGSGKTTQARLLTEWLREQRYEVVFTRDPGGTDIGEQIRVVLHALHNTDMTPWAEVFLYSASRAQLVAQVIRPALVAEKLVVSDRFYGSTLAYQGYGRGLDLKTLRAITAFATGGLAPDLTLCLDIAPQAGLARRRSGEGEWNRLDAETLEFHQRVRAGYLELAGQETARWVVIDADHPPDEVHAQIRGTVEARLGRETRDTQQVLRVACSVR